MGTNSRKSQPLLSSPLASNVAHTGILPDTISDSYAVGETDIELLHHIDITRKSSSLGELTKVPTSLLLEPPTFDVPDIPVEREEYDDEEASSSEGYDQAIPTELIDKLSKFPLFKNAPLAFHKAIVGRLKPIQYHAQEFIVKVGEPAKSMYWILRGSVAVTPPDGEAVHAELVAGQFFGEIGILFNRPRTATVIARTKVLLGVLTADNFNSVLPDFPAVERMIRDEAQERLSMQDKRKRNGVTNIIPNYSNSNVLSLKDSIGSVASTVANANASIPGPSIPPKVYPHHYHQQSSNHILRLESIFQSLLSDNNKLGLPQIHDNVDNSIPTRDFLRSLPMFTLLPSKIIHELVLGVEPKRYESFEYIVRKGETGREIYFIVNGEVEVLHISRINSVEGENKPQNVDRVIARLGTGQYFGEMAFLQSLSKDSDKPIIRSADIRSITTVDVLVVSGAQLENLFARYPRICDEMEETATKRLKRNKDVEGSNKPQESLFNKWIGSDTSSLFRSNSYQPSSSSLTIGDSDTPSAFPKPIVFDIGPTENPTRRAASPLSILSSDQSSVISKTSYQLNSGRSSPVSNSNSIDDPSKVQSSIVRKRRPSITSIVPLDQRNPGPFNLNPPPLNPTSPSVNNFPSQQRIQPFQYMNHAKRFRMASISNRRRSSILSSNTLPDRLLLKTFEFLSLPELMKLRIICRRWRQLLYVAPNFFETLDLRPWNTSVNDDALIQITDFVGSRPKVIDISNCFHITDVGFCYMFNEIGLSGNLKEIKMRSVWDVSAMAIMDLAVPSIGHHIEKLDFSNCRKVRDDVIERIIGWKKKENNGNFGVLDSRHGKFNELNSLEQPLPGMEEFEDDDYEYSNHTIAGCPNLTHLNLSYCKHLTDRIMYHIALHASDRLQSLDITRCTTITDAGFAFWAYQPLPNLRRLKLGDCTFLTDKSIVAITSSAQSLESLDISFCCGITDVSVEVLCLGCPGLKYLDLSFCGSAVSDSSLLAISIHLRNLEVLIIKGCIRVTRAGVDALLSSSIPLKYLDISQCRNAHSYKNNTPAAEIKPRKGTRSAFVMTARENIVEMVI